MAAPSVDEDHLGRYVGEDGPDGEEGAFFVCTFRLIDAELASGRIDQARAVISRPP